MSPIPDTRALKSDHWERLLGTGGLSFDDGSYLSLLRAVEKYRCEYESFPLDPEPGKMAFFLQNGFYEMGDAHFLYGAIRYLKPARIIEAGSGYTTQLMSLAASENKRETGILAEIVACDPYPRTEILQDIPNLELISEPFENQSRDLVKQLKQGDVLFIDSSHVVRQGSDVVHLFLETIPCVAPGVWIHLHDIFLPEDYPKSWVMDEHRFWSEQYLLQTFLAFNSEFKIRWPGNYMRLHYPAELETAFPHYRTNEKWMGAFWIERQVAQAIEHEPTTDP